MLLSFNLTAQIQDNLFIYFTGTTCRKQTLETQAFVAICDRLFLAFSILFCDYQGTYLDNLLLLLVAEPSVSRNSLAFKVAEHSI